MSSLIIGIDVGNHSTKSRHTSTVSGYQVSDICPTDRDDSLFVNGKYYTPLSAPFSYSQDKTINDQCVYCSLFAIAEEILYIYSRKDELHYYSKEEIQRSINDIEGIHLGVGLPPQHLATLKDKTLECYTNFFSGGVSFTYKGFSFNFKVHDVFLFAQGYSLVMLRKNSAVNSNSMILKNLIKKGEKYTSGVLAGQDKDGYTDIKIVDIGGYTLDVIGVSNLRPDVSLCATREKGSLKLYEKIRTEVVALGGPELETTVIEKIISNPNSMGAQVVAKKYRDTVDDICRLWAKDIVGQVRELGVNFSSQPIIFLGGTSMLLKKYILEDAEILERYNSTPSLVEFIEIPEINAWGYEEGVRMVLAQKKKQG